MSEEPSYSIILLEVRPNTKVKISCKPKDGIVGIRTTRPIKDSFLRAKFWTTFDALVEEATRE